MTTSSRQPRLDRALWQQVEAVLDEALDLPSESREAYLDEACSGRPELRRRTAAILRGAERDDGFLDASLAEFAAPLFDVGGLAGEEGAGFPIDLVGSTLGRYRVEREISAGGMGIVYAGHDSLLARSVALKVLRPEFTLSPRAQERLRREARAASRLEHPNICPVLDIGTTAWGQDYIVLPFYASGSLQDRLEAGPLPVAAAERVAAELLDGLAAVHALGIVHRDVKPGNVLFGDDGRVKLVDFGIAVAADDERMTVTGEMPGTPAYMSPEQAAGETLDHRTDIWSVGVVLYQMLTGRRPFQGGSRDAIRDAIRTREPPSVASCRADIPKYLQHAVAAALCKSVAERPSSAVELRALVVGAPRSPPAPAATQNRRTVFAAVTVLAAAAVASLAGLLWLRSPAPPAVFSPPRSAQTAGAGVPLSGLAVALFDDRSRMPELGWLRIGLQELLSVELGQSPEIDLLSTGEVHRLLGDEPGGESRALGEILRQQTGVQFLLRGAYQRREGALHVEYTLDDLRTGRVRLSGASALPGVNGLNRLVDEIAAGVRGELGASKPAVAPATVEAATTSSLAAWQHYVQAHAWHFRGDDAAAVREMEEAISIDPTFALALLDLSALHANLGNPTEARAYAERALASRERLPLDQRLVAEARGHAQDWDSIPDAILAYQRQIELFPREIGARVNLGRLYVQHERFEEALAQYDAWLAADVPFAPGYAAAAAAHEALGEAAVAVELLAGYVQRYPDDWYAAKSLAWQHLHAGDLESASRALARAALLAPDEPGVADVAWHLHTVRDEWEQAERTARVWSGLGDAKSAWSGAIAEARSALYRGRSDAALAALDRAIGAYPEPVAETAMARCLKAEVFLARAEPVAALQAAAGAVEAGRGAWPGVEGMALAALAHAMLGETGAAGELRAALEARLERAPNVVERRQLNSLRGRSALVNGQLDAARLAFGEAEALLAPRGIKLDDLQQPSHVPIWYDLARTELRAERPARARVWLEKITAAGVERLDYPVEYVRSLYLLGRLAADAGEREVARDLLLRFTACRASGADLDVDWYQAALGLLAQ